jgi:hypothetical protein
MAVSPWLYPAANSVVEVPISETGGTANPTWSGSLSGIAANPLSGAGPICYLNGDWKKDYSRALYWDWVIPAGTFPGNATVDQVEFRWIAAYRTVPSGGYAIGMVTPVYGGFDPDTSTQINHSYTGNTLDVNTITPTETFFYNYQVPPGLTVADFLSSSNPYGHSRVQMHLAWPDPGVSAYLELYQVAMRITYTAPATDIDLASSASTAVAIGSTSIKLGKSLAASMALTVSPAGADIAIDTLMTASFQPSVDMAMDITEGFGYIDSTCLVDLGTEISSPNIVVGVDFDAVDVGFGLEFGVSNQLLSYPLRARNLSAQPAALFDMDPFLYSNDEMYTSFRDPWMDVGVTANLGGNVNIEADLQLSLTMAADLGGDITLNVVCFFDDDPWTMAFNVDVFSFGTSISYGISSDIPFSVNLFADEMATIYALEADIPIAVNITPSVTIISKFAELVPCDRTMNLCPKEREIIFNCQPRFM